MAHGHQAKNYPSAKREEPMPDAVMLDLEILRGEKCRTLKQAGGEPYKVAPQAEHP